VCANNSLASGVPAPNRAAAVIAAITPLGKLVFTHFSYVSNCLG
jgi:hypothetical protein